ncbi:MAG TPA: hypothetical protein VF460_05715 [Burkholderiales bacterium]
MEGFTGGGDAISAALDALATKMDLGLLLIDSQGSPVFSNRTALELLGCRDSAALPQRWAALQSSMQPPAAGAVAQDSATFTADLAIDGGTRFLRGESRRARDGMEVFLRDRRRLGELDMELLCASRMREWVNQCDALVHDANGALNTIHLTLELLDGQWPGQQADEQVREPHRRNHVGVIRDNVDKLKRTLRQFSASHDGGPASAVFDLRDVVNEAVATLRMLARRRRISLQARAGETMLPVTGNRGRIRQALVNVALARLEHLPERSVLLIEAHASAEGPEILCKDAGPLGDSIEAGIYRLLLADAGAGSNSDFLRLARAIVECEGGEFRLGCEPAAATVFSLRFPRAAS